MSYELYQPEERALYKHYDGKEVVAKDPMVLYKRLAEVSGDLSAWVKLAFSPSKDAKDGHTKVVEKARVIFEVKPYEEGGLTESETVNLLFHFWNYCELQKKTTSSYPTTSTDPSTSSSDCSDESPPTTNTGDCI
jgi:hypothetical protein